MSELSKLILWLSEIGGLHPNLCAPAIGELEELWAKVERLESRVNHWEAKDRELADAATEFIEDLNKLKEGGDS